MDKQTKRILRELHPNHGSRRQTTTTLLIDAHYADLCLIERWTWERFQRLASFLQLTHAELASLALLPHAWLTQWPKTNILPIPRDQGAYAQALLLTLLEARVLQNWSNDIIANPFPSPDTYSHGRS